MISLTSPILLIPLFSLMVLGKPTPTTDLQLMKELREFLNSHNIDLPAQLKSRALQNRGDVLFDSYDQEEQDKQIAFALASAAMASVKYDEEKKGFVGLPTEVKYSHQSLSSHNEGEQPNENDRVINSLAKQTMELTSKILSCQIAIFNKFIRSCRQNQNMGNLPSISCEEQPCEECLEYNALNGTIWSANYPNGYGNNKNCTATILAPLGSTIRLEFTDFSVEKNYDFITITDGTGKQIRNPMTGYNIPSSVFSKGNKMVLRFATDDDGLAVPDGVILKWKANVSVKSQATTSTTSTEAISTSSTTEVIPSITTSEISTTTTEIPTTTTEEPTTTTEVPTTTTEEPTTTTELPTTTTELPTTTTEEPTTTTELPTTTTEIPTTTTEPSTTTTELPTTTTEEPTTTTEPSTTTTEEPTTTTEVPTTTTELPTTTTEIPTTTTELPTTTTELPTTTTEPSTTTTEEPTTTTEVPTTTTELPTTTTEIPTTTTELPTTTTELPTTTTEPSTTTTEEPTTTTELPTTTTEEPTTTTELPTTTTEEPTTTTEVPTTTTELPTTTTEIPTTTTELPTTTTEPSTTTTELPTTTTEEPTTTTELPTTTTEVPTTTPETPSEEPYCLANSCGGCTGSSLGLIIRSPDFPNDYGNNRDCNYTIRSPVGTSLRIEFTTFVVEQDYDSISVYDQNSKALRTGLSGYVKPFPFVIKSNQVSIIFKSDGDNLAIPDEMTGSWIANVTIRRPRTPTKRISSESFRTSIKELESTVRSLDSRVICSSSSCGRCFNVTSKGGIIQSPNYPYDYGENRNCSYTVEVPPNAKIQLSFPTFDLEPDYDFISVFDENLLPLRMDLSGSSNPSPVNSKGNKITIVFNADSNNHGMINDDEGRWEAKFRVISPSPTLSQSSDEMKRFSNKKLFKPKKADTFAARVMRRFETIFGGKSQTLDTEKEVPTIIENQTKNGMVLKPYFRTFLNSGVTCRATHESCGTCVDITSEGGTIQSPNYPADYGNNKNCNFTVEVPLHSAIQLDFTTFILEEDYDFISIYDGATTELRTHISGYAIPAPITTKANKVSIIFKTDSNNAGLTNNKMQGKWEAKFVLRPRKSLNI